MGEARQSIFLGQQIDEHEELARAKRVTLVDLNGDPVSSEGSAVSNNDLMTAMRILMQAIANPSYIDKSANAIRNQVQSGTITTVTTLTGLTNIDGYQGKLQIINQNNSAWANVVRARIS